MKKWTKTILFVLALAAIFVWVEIAKSPSADMADNNVHLFFLNVGQGDSELIEKGDQQILIDGGPDDSVLQEIGKVMPVYDRKIETVILTHPHADHLVGLNQILDRYEIGQVYYSGVNYKSNGYDELLNKIKQKNIPLSVPKVGEKSEPFPDSEMTFLWPGEKYQNKELDNLNNASEVVKFCYFLNCALFTGDIETDEQTTMFSSCKGRQNSLSFRATTAFAEEPRNLSKDPSTSVGMTESEVGTTDGEAGMTDCGVFQSDLLKLAHHGSTNGTNQALLDIVKPKYGVIEVGADNKYGHPHAATLALLDRNKIKYFRTDRDGTIEFVFSKDGIIKK